MNSPAIEGAKPLRSGLTFARLRKRPSRACAEPWTRSRRRPADLGFDIVPDSVGTPAGERQPRAAAGKLPRASRFRQNDIARTCSHVIESLTRLNWNFWDCT